MKNVLVFPCGTEIGMEIFHSLSANKHFKLFGASSVPDHGRVLFSSVHSLPFISSPDFISKLNNLIDKLGITFIYPAHDDALLYLCEVRNTINAEIIAPDFDACSISRSKSRTYLLLNDCDFIPEMYSKNDLESIQYPAFIKPDLGQGSQGAQPVKNEQELKCYLSNRKDVVITEFLPGKEFTIDCFTTRKQELIYVQARERKRTRSGISVNSVIVGDSSIFWKYAKAISNVVDFRGVWFFQMKEDRGGQLKLLEIAPRIAGTMGVSRSNGVNLCALTLYDRLNIDVEVYENKLNMEVERALVNRYLNIPAFYTVYIDLDDTIIVNERVNKTILMLLYQWHDKEIILLTRHKFDPIKTLEKHKIDSRIFSRIIRIGEEDEKSNYIERKSKSIFIDDSFSERNAVLKKCHVPVFDVNEVEGLIDWRSDIS